MKTELAMSKELHYFLKQTELRRKQKKAILLSSVGAQTYKLLKNLSMPSKPADKTFPELVQMMTNHQDPKPNSIAERWFEVIPVSNSTSETTINYLRTCFATHGLPPNLCLR